MDAVLRVVTRTLLEPSDEAWRQVTNQLSYSIDDNMDGTEEKEAVALCLNYLKRRIGVPRDMTYPAARQLRAHLTWAEEQLMA